MKKTINVVIPVYNEEKVLEELIKRLHKVAEGENDYCFEFIMVENGSNDSSYSMLRRMSQKDERIKIIRLSRNFGCDGAITAGLKYAKGDAACIMNADLQDPPELMHEFIRAWQAGHDIVYGVIRKRHGEMLLRKVLSSMFYIVINTLTRGLFPRNASDFRLISRKVISAVNSLRETNRYVRGIVAWTGFSHIGVEFERPPRFAGKSKSNMFAIFKVAMNGIFSFSYLPLRMTTFLGIMMSTVSFLMMIGYIIAYFIYGRTVPGHTSIIVTMLFLFGVLFFVLGIIGEYLARVYDEVKGRPNYIVSETIGI